MNYNENFIAIEWAMLKILLEESLNKLLPGLFKGFYIVGTKINNNECEYSIMPPNGDLSRNNFSINSLGKVSFTKICNPQYEYCYFEDSPYEGANLFVLLQLDKKKKEKISKLSKPQSNGSGIPYKIYPSIIDAFLDEIKPIIHNLFRSGNSLEFPLPSPSELIRNAGKTFLHNIALKGGKKDFSHYAFNLFEDLTFIANTKYEKKNVAGGIVFAESNHPNINCIINFQEKYNISEIKRIRKYLELSDVSKDQYLLSDSGCVYGLGSVEGYNPQNENLFKVVFENDGKWSLHHGDQCILNINRGIPSIPYPQFDDEFLKRLLIYTFGNIDAQNWINCVDSLVCQNKGGVLVINQNAPKEAIRLSKDSTKIHPLQLNSHNIAKLSSIDGAILADENGVCYSIGVILDGTATTKGSSTRGARYNSSIRYCEDQLKRGIKVIVVVISDDGMVDIFPSKPQRINPILSRLRWIKFKLFSV